MQTGILYLDVTRYKYLSIDMKVVGRCVYCLSPIYPHEKWEMSGTFIPFHKQCLLVFVEKRKEEGVFKEG